jgi:hypothetical protein
MKIRAIESQLSPLFNSQVPSPKTTSFEQKKSVEGTVRLEYLKQLQSSEPLHATRPLILLLVWFTVCMCSNSDLFRRTVLRKCERDINCSLDCGSQVKITSFRNPNQNRAALWRIFSLNDSVPANRKTGFYGDRDPNKQEVGFIFA